jgi:hypothetical protein
MNPRAGIVGLAVLAAVAPLAAAGLSAQAGFHRVFVGGGLGAGGVTQHPEGLASATRFSVNALARVGWRVSRAVSLQLEYELHRLVDESPDAADVLPDLTVPAPADVFRTQFLLVSVELRSRQGFFARPGVGVGQHRFGTYIVCDVPGCRVAPETSNEFGLAGGIAAGAVRSLSDRLDVRLEGLWRYSQGEDSTAPRTAFGVQAACVVGF